MSIAEYALGEGPVADQPTESTGKKTPPRRQMVAKADSTAQPEAR